VLCAIAAVELMGFQLSLDQGAILDSPRWWARVLWYYPALFNIALVCGGAIAVLARAQIVRVGKAWAVEATAFPIAPYLATHAVLIAVLYALSVAGFQRGVAAGANADLWFLAWLFCGVLAVAAWGCALARPPLWIDLLRNSSRSISWGTALGCVLWQSAETLNQVFFEFGRLPTLLAVVATLRATGHDVAYTEEPARIVFEGFGIRMSSGCLGYEGISLVLVFCAAYLVALRRELAFPRSFLLVALAALASWGMNVLRVAALVLIGAKRGVYAIEGFHSVAGWLYFAAIAAGIVAVSQRRWFARQGRESVETEGWRSPVSAAPARAHRNGSRLEDLPHRPVRPPLPVARAPCRRGPRHLPSSHR
jgi:exosortase/archaeosortase family protein